MAHVRAMSRLSGTITVPRAKVGRKGNNERVMQDRSEVVAGRPILYAGFRPACWTGRDVFHRREDGAEYHCDGRGVEHLQIEALR